MIGIIRDWFARNVLAALFRDPADLLWTDRHGVLRDLTWRRVDIDEYRAGGTD